jgi:hypothetical protein
MKLGRRKFLHLAACAAGSSVTLGLVHADTYPGKPIRLVVPVPPGGRAVSDYQNCLLDNTANLSACERQRAAMNGAATVLFGRSNKGNTIVNDGR